MTMMFLKIFNQIPIIHGSIEQSRGWWGKNFVWSFIFFPLSFFFFSLHHFIIYQRIKLIIPEKNKIVLFVVSIVEWAVCLSVGFWLDIVCHSGMRWMNKCIEIRGNTGYSWGICKIRKSERNLLNLMKKLAK